MSTIDKTLEDALDILDKDITKIKKLSSDKKTLDRGESSKLTDYIKTLLLVRKEDREQLKSENVLTKSDQELEELAKQAIEFLKEDEEKDTEEDNDSDDKPTDTEPSDTPKDDPK